MALIDVAIGSALAILLYRLVLSIAEYVRNARQARLIGCKPVRSPDKNDLFGVRTAIALSKARPSRTLPVQVGLDMDKVGENPHTVQRRLPLVELIKTRDPENIKTILSTQSSHWELGEIRWGIMSAYVGTGLLTNEGPACKHSRPRLRPQFSQVSVSELALCEKHAQELMRKLVPGTDGWTGNTDLQPLFFNFTLNNPVTQAALGGPGKTGPPNGEVFAASIDVVTDWVGGMSTIGNWYKYAPARQFKRSRAKIYEMVEWYVNRAVERARDKFPTKPLEPSRFVLLDELAKNTDDKLWLRNETIGLLTGGHSTSAALLSWLFYYLARQRSLYHKLRRSIVEAFGTGYEARHITASQLRAFQYLRACIYEALRLGSPTHTSVRSAARDTRFPGVGVHKATIRYTYQRVPQ
ncbi:MAG: hypothetical protein Q9180_005155 [Flavoplaca navasiana]